MKVKNPKDFWAGILFLVIGSGALWLNQAHELGTAAAMGPGYFPMLLAGGIVFFGLVTLVRGLAVTGEPMETWYLRPLAVVAASIVAFGLLIQPIGLGPTVVIVSAIAALASREKMRWGETAILAVVLATFTVLLFVTLLGQPLAIWGER